MLGECAAIRRARRALWALALGASSAGAAELDYRAPQGCPSRDELIFRIERGLGRPLERTPAARFDAEVHAASGGYVGTLQLSEVAPGPERERQLRAQSCSELVDALSVAVVLAIGALENESEQAPRRATEPSVGPTAAAPAPAAVPAPADAAPAAPASAALQVHPGVLALVFGDVGSLPSPALGGGLGVGLALGRWRVRAAVQVLLEQHVAVPGPGTPAPGADLSLVFGALSGCHGVTATSDSRAELAVCAGMELGQLSGQGRELRNAEAKQALWLALSGGLEGRWQWTHNLYAYAQLGACVPLNHDQFVVAGSQAVHRPSNLVGRGGLGLGWDWE